MKKDKFTHIRDLFNQVIQNCRDNWVAGPVVTIDKQLVGFRGRCPFRMYISNKPNKYGIKIFMVCDSDSQYCLNAIPYCGIGTVPHQYQNLLQGEYFTMELLRPNLIQNGRVVCADNWFTSLSLARTLQQKGMHLVGTILKKPQLPCQYVLDCKIPMKENLAIYNHKERINVVFKRTKPKKTWVSLPQFTMLFSNVEDKKTEAHMFYNASKGGVDTFDHMCAHYDIGRKTRRWPLCVFYGLLNIATTISFVIFTSRPANRLKSRHDFSQDLAYNLARPHAHQRYMNKQFLTHELCDQI